MFCPHEINDAFPQCFKLGQTPDYTTPSGSFRIQEPINSSSGAMETSNLAESDFGIWIQTSYYYSLIKSPKTCSNFVYHKTSKTSVVKHTKCLKHNPGIQGKRLDTGKGWDFDCRLLGERLEANFSMLKG